MLEQQADERRFLALGDSYTIGEGVARSHRWPMQLVRLLARANLPIEDPQFIATTGWTTAELGSGIDRANPVGPFQLVSLLIGVNDQYRGVSAVAYGRRFAQLLRRAVGLVCNRPSRVIVLSIPDWGVTPFAAKRDRASIRAAIDRFNGINLQASIRTGASYVNVTAMSREAAADSSLLAADGLHPSGKMYRRWAERVFPAARAAIESNRTSS